MRKKARHHQWWHTFVGAKHTFSPSVSPLTHTLTHIWIHLHRMGAPSTRKETEIGNKDHPLCLRTLNGSGNVFNLSPESNNGAHSTPPRYCSTVHLKALGFYHPSLLQFFHISLPLWAVSWRDSFVGRERKGMDGWKGEGSTKEIPHVWLIVILTSSSFTCEWHLLCTVLFIHTIWEFNFASRGQVSRIFLTLTC